MNHDQKYPTHTLVFKITLLALFQSSKIGTELKTRSSVYLCGTIPKFMDGKTTEDKVLKMLSCGTDPKFKNKDGYTTENKVLMVPFWYCSKV